MASDRVERKLTAILATDVVGYSRLMAEGEVGTLARLNAHMSELIEPAIAEFRGRMVKTTGDGALVEFGSVVDAVECAVKVQRAMVKRNADVPEEKRIIFRIGVNLGDVIIQGDDIYGDGVNVASRLEAMAEPGGICIRRTVRNQVRDKIPLKFEDLGEQEMKNIPRPVRVFKVSLEEVDVAETVSATKNSLSDWMRWAAAVGILLIAVIGGGTWWWSQQPDFEPVDPDQITLTLPKKPSIAVLPFDNMSNDAEQEYFVDGMTDDLITDLSKISSLFVIARNSTFAYKGRNVEPNEVARELGVRYILIGSVRTVNGRVRINSQLIDTRTREQIWAERFDRELSDIFALQDDVTSQIVSALALQLTSEEKHRLTPSEEKTNLEAYDLYLRGVQALRQFTPESIATARSYFLKALTLDPNYARAHAAMAFTYTASGIFYREENVDEALVEAIRYGQRALDINPKLPQGYFAMAIAYLRQARHDQALTAARNAVKFDPNYADGYVALANVLVFSGKGREALKFMSRAMMLNPRYSAAYLDILGRAYFVEEKYAEAIQQFTKCISRDPAAISCHAFLAASYALGERVSDAEWEAEEVRNLESEFSVTSNNISYQFKYEEQKELFEKGLRIAGLPE